MISSAGLYMIGEIRIRVAKTQVATDIVALNTYIGTILIGNYIDLILESFMIDLRSRRNQAYF